MSKIKFELPDDLKTALKSYAAANRMSVAACIRQAIKNEITDKNGQPKYPDMNDCTDGERTRRVYAYFSDTEYREIISRAKGHPLSAYIRRTALSATVPIHIEIGAEDVQVLVAQVAGFVRQFSNYLEGARYRTMITEDDYRLLLEISTGISEQLSEYIRLTHNNQTAIRSAGIRHIKKQLNIYLKEDATE